MTTDSDMAAPGAPSAPEGASKSQAQEQVWDGHGEASQESPADLMRELLSYETPYIGEVFVLWPRTRLGEAVLTIHAPDRYEVTSPVPDGCNLIEDDSCPLDGSEDTVTRTLAELVAELVEYHGLGDGMSEDDMIEAEITYWRQGAPQAFRLDLVPCEVPASSEEVGA